jgi:hypothetical protein
MLQEVVKLQELRIELANKRGFTSPDIMEVFDEEVHRYGKSKIDYAAILENTERGEFRFTGKFENDDNLQITEDCDDYEDC